MKNLKLFEQYSEDYSTDMTIMESLYEDWALDNAHLFLNEEGEWNDDDDQPLSAGERRALARDFQIMSKPQLAALYLKALGKSEDEQDSNEYLVMIDGIENFGARDKNTGRFVLTLPALADAIGLNSRRTAQRTISKFYNLITGVGETTSESIYDKLVKAYEEFEKRNPRELAMLASEALQDPMMSTKNREEAEAEGPRSRAQRIKREEEQIKRGEKVYGYIQSLKNAGIFRGNVERLVAKGIETISRELGIPPERIEADYVAYLKKMDQMNPANYPTRR
jgi:hypothetical protein